MKALLTALVMLTALDGTPIWIESDAVTMIRPSITQCHSANGGAIRVGGTAVCVRESPEQIRKVLGK